MATEGHDPAGHGHLDDSGHVDPGAIQRGHEEDKVDVKGILYVPLALVVTFVLAYITVNLLFNYLRAPGDKMPERPAARAGEAAINERFDTINQVYNQPRLEGLQRVEYGPGEAPWTRSMAPTIEGNSPHFHPEDMRPSSEHGRKLGLQDYAWKNREHTAVRLPIEEAMRLALDPKMKDPANPNRSYLTTAAKPIDLEKWKLLQPKASNPHWGTAVGGHGHDDHKEDHKHETKGKDKQ